jgi:hypothetical protein
MHTTERHWRAMQAAGHCFLFVPSGLPDSTLDCSPWTPGANALETSSAPRPCRDPDLMPSTAWLPSLRALGRESGTRNISACSPTVLLSLLATAEIGWRISEQGQSHTVRSSIFAPPPLDHFFGWACPLSPAFQLPALLVLACLTDMGRRVGVLSAT